MRVIIFLITLLTATAVFAHGAIHEQIKATNQRIKKQPRNAELYIHRGRLYLDDDHLKHAKADFKKALVLDPKNKAAHYFLGETLLKSHHPQDAEREAKAFMQALQPEEQGGLVRGYRLLGASLFEQKQWLAAAQAYQNAIRQASQPEPAQYLESAQAFQMAGETHLASALQVLDEGIAKLGTLTVLQEAAIDIELKLAHPDAALTRLGTLIATGKGQEYWLYQRGTILAQNQRPQEAQQAFAQALQAIKALPERRQNTKPVIKLQHDIAVALQSLPAK